jgi:methanogenic corrinoid protein MtbC1
MVEGRAVTAVFDDALSRIPPESILAYRNKIVPMVDSVNKAMAAHPRLEKFLGGNPFLIMEENHLNHARYMASAFALKSGAGFISTVSWVYKTYISRGFSPDYFPTELEAWRTAVAGHLDEDSARPIRDFYETMIARHEDFIELSKNCCTAVSIQESDKDMVRAYVDAVLKPSMAEAVELCREHITSVSVLQYWWQRIIEPAMYEVGRLWEEGLITVGQEHLATSITQRVMSMFYRLILELPRNKGKVVMAASPGELHELGPRMVADLLEIGGWDTCFTGANTPSDSLVRLLQDQQAEFLCLSTTLSFNLIDVMRVINDVRTACPDSAPKIIVGGQAYSSDSTLWQKVGADAFAAGAADALTLMGQDK